MMIRRIGILSDCRIDQLCFGMFFARINDLCILSDRKVGEVTTEFKIYIGLQAVCLASVSAWVLIWLGQIICRYIGSY